MKIDSYKAFVAMFYALDAAYDNEATDELGRFLSAANPFLFEGKGSADPAVYEEFRVGFPEEIGEAGALSFVRDYLAGQGEFLLTAFDSIANFDAWREALRQLI